MARLPHVLLLLLLVSVTCAAQETSSPDKSNVGLDAISDANAAIRDRARLNNALSLEVLTSTGSSTRQFEQFRVSKTKQPSHRVYRVSQFALIASTIADVGTTWTLSNGRIEANPLLGRSRAQQALVSSGLAVFILWDAHLLHTRGKTRAAKSLLWIGSIAHAFGGLYNSR
jgi:hypothetical protein